MKEVGHIKDLCLVIAGQSPKGSSYNESGEGMEFHQGKKAFGETHLESSNVWTTEITKIAEPGDILMSVRAPVGPTNLTDRKVCIGRGLAAIRCSKDVLPQFILYALRNIESKIVGNDGAVFNSINKNMIEDLPLPIVPLSSQQEIVTYLDTAFEKIDRLKENAEKSLSDAKALFQSALKEMMQPKEGWKEKRLNEIVISLTDGDHMPPPKADDGIPFITISNIDKNYRTINFDDTFFVPQEYYDNLTNERKPTSDDILYTVTGSFGIPVIVRGYGEFCFQRHIALIRPKTNIIKTDYLYYWFLTPEAIKKADEVATGAAQRTVSLTSLRNFVIAFPRVKEQNEIIKRCNMLYWRVSSLETNYTKTVAECEALKQALLRQVFE